MKGKWAQGIQPRNFAWVLQDRFAVCERPGGYGQNHRRVRRQEEIIWIREQGFTCVVSLIPSPHNLHNYDELGVTWIHRPYGLHDDHRSILGDLYPELRSMLGAGGKLLLHQDELGDKVSGVVGGYLLWAGLIPSGPQATTITEQLLHRQMGPLARELVGVATQLPPTQVGAHDMGDVIELRGLRLLGICGVLPHEQEAAQPIEVDLDVEADLAAAGASDDLADTVDYGALCAQVEAVVTEERFALLEHLAARVADVVLADSRVRSVTVAARKLRPPVPQQLATSGVRITRSR